MQKLQEQITVDPKSKHMDDVHDCMDAGGRVKQEQLPRRTHKCRGGDRTTVMDDGSTSNTGCNF